MGLKRLGMRCGSASHGPIEERFALGGCLFGFALFLVACGGGSGPPPAQPDFNFAVFPNILSVGVGDTSAPATLSVNGQNGFAGTVTVTVTGLPEGASSSPASPFTLTPGGSQQVTFLIPVNVSAGELPVTFHGESGSLQHDFAFRLTIVPCLTGGTEAEIQAALDSSVGFADLCPGATFIVSGPLRMGSAYQKGSRIFTAGYPKASADKARIVVADHVDNWPDDPGDGWGNPVLLANGDDMRIQNIRLDGNIAHNLFKSGYDPLLRVRGQRNTVDSIEAVNTFGPPAVDAVAGPSCTDYRLTNNFIASSGFHPDPDGHWSDGIQIFCSNSYVAYNEVRDSTDVGLILFGGTNTVIEFNKIENWARSAYGGLVADPETNQDESGHPLPIPQDFSNTIFRNNTVETCCGQHIHVALSAGVHLWCDDTANTGLCAFGTGLTMQDNQLSGLFGYGLYMGGMQELVFTGNTLNMTELTWVNCYEPNQNFYVLDHATGTFQDGYVTRVPLHWPCLVGADHPFEPFAGSALRRRR